MDKMVKRLKKSVGCANKTSKSSLVDNDYLEPIASQKQNLIENEFKNENKCDITVKIQERRTLGLLKRKSRKEKILKQASCDSNYYSDPEYHLYEEIDENNDSENELLIDLDDDKNGSKNNLYCEANHQANSTIKPLEDAKNTRKTFVESKYNRLREYLFLNKENTNAQPTYHVLLKQNELIESKQIQNRSTIDNENDKAYLLDDDCEENINDDYEFCLLDKQKTDLDSKQPKKSFKLSYNKLNEVFIKRTNNENYQTTGLFDRLTLKRKLTTFDGQQQQQDDCNAAKKKKQFTCLTEIKPTSLFAKQSDGIIWYFNLLCDTMLFHIKDNKQLTSPECRLRINWANAHLLYVKNLYEVRIAGSKHLKQILSTIHPCTIALALLLDSDAIRICESHTCACDNYVYLFSTKIKFCSWKAKYFIILKKPKQSSFDRLNLIEDLINCHKLIQDKSIL